MCLGLFALTQSEHDAAAEDKPELAEREQEKRRGRDRERKRERKTQNSRHLQSLHLSAVRFRIADSQFGSRAPGAAERAIRDLSQWEQSKWWWWNQVASTENNMKYSENVEQTSGFTSVYFQSLYVVDLILVDSCKFRTEQENYIQIPLVCVNNSCVAKSPQKSTRDAIGQVLTENKPIRIHN